MQMKIALFTIISRFQIDICSKTPQEIIPEKKKFVFNIQGGMWLKMEKIG